MDTLIFTTVSVLLTTTAILFTIQLQRAFKNFILHKTQTAEQELPSVSVCIPARNETHAMTRCLENVLASDYEKLEIIVFDDDSADNTSILIKSFAHAGVRFVPGEDLPEGWLGKNHALNVLAKEASGTLVLFMDVDTIIDSKAISRLVSYVLTEKIDMVSVIPRRNDTWRISVLFGTLRYFWQLIFSQKSRPTATGALWMVSRGVLLEDLGGMESFKSIVQPEVHIARALRSSKSRVLIGNDVINVSFEKRWRSQVETSRRLLYPMVGNNLAKASLAILCLLALNIPLVVVLSGLYYGWTEYQIVAVWFVCVFSAIYAMYTHYLWRNKWWLGGLVWSLVIFQELCLLVYSVVGYLTKSITWKGRPVVVVSRTSEL